MNQQLIDRCKPTGQKRILACDGGGILGLISVEILARLEAQLRSAAGNRSLVLADYFDFVCGTSTGAVIATCIAAGMPMDRVREFYLTSGEQMFDKASLLKRLHYSYNAEPLALKLRAELNAALGHGADDPPALLGDPALRTLLMMVMRNHSTDSPWPVSNNPYAKYNQRVKDDGSPRADCNLDLPLWQLVRASTAAPTFFPPEVVTLARGTPHEYQFVFVDGGVTTYNNPAFLAFQMATAAPYGLNWPTGRERMLLVSVGTGSAAKARPDLQAGDLWLLDHAKNIPAALMNAACAGWDMACRLLGECRYGPPIDREYGDMVTPPGTTALNATVPKLFTYLRYDPDVSQAGLDALGVAARSENVQQLDSVRHVAEIQRVGMAYAQRDVLPQHLSGFEPVRTG
jgi:predicted acylesterase/phospholipase RssA